MAANNTDNTKTTFTSVANQVAVLNTNSVEIISQLNNILTSPNQTITITITNMDGSQSTYSVPTISWLTSQIDIANNTINRLTNAANKDIFVVNGKSTKKLISSDLNQEPDKIGTLNTVNTFLPVNNWFFESLMNPLLTITVDLNDKIDDNAEKVLSRRYIVNFEKDSTGALTTKGQQSLSDFQTKYINKNNISIAEFEQWYTNTTNTGIVNNSTLLYDEQVFDFNSNELNYFGEFTIIRTETDTVNNKLWYHLNTLNYYDKGGNIYTLKISDELFINSTSSTTRFRIKEISTASSFNRVVLEYVEGYDPAPVGLTNGIKFYSDTNFNKSINISIGFEEYDVIFLKAIDSTNNLRSSLWSDGFAFYSNDLTLSTDKNVTMSSYYQNTVYDYGTLLKDMVTKNIPSKFGIVPQPPTLVADNFKVVSINDHLISEDTNKLKDLQAQKTSIKSNIDQLSQAIIQKNKELNAANITEAQKASLNSDLNNLISTKDTQTSLLSTVVTQITSIDTTNYVAQYRVRGFWDIPAPVQVSGQPPQEIIQFKIQYRYLSKSGDENKAQGFTISNSAGTSLNGYFSNWNLVASPVRERFFDSNTNTWSWKTENISDANSININQLDIPIQTNEQVEFQIKSISEVGYPNAPLESDWSASISIVFPDNLNTLTTTAQIQSDATVDSVKLEFQKVLITDGYKQHISDSYYIGDKYVAHVDKDIQTNFTDSNGNTINLFDYLTQLTKRISDLEEIVNRSTGELQVILNKPNGEKVIMNNKSSLVINVECEDYGTQYTSSRAYYNSLYIIKDYSLSINNIASKSELGFLTTFTYISGNTYKRFNDRSPAIVDDNHAIISQRDGQFIYFEDQSSNPSSSHIYYGIDISNYTNAYTGALSNTYLNVGLIDDYVSGLTMTDQTTLAGYTPLIWVNNSASSFMTTVNPNVSDPTFLYSSANTFNNIKIFEAGSTFNIPINIYFKFSSSGVTSVDYSANPQTQTHKKYLKMFLQKETDSAPFECELAFNLNRNRTATVVGNTNYTTTRII